MLLPPLFFSCTSVGSVPLQAPPKAERPPMPATFVACQSTIVSFLRFPTDRFMLYSTG